MKKTFLGILLLPTAIFAESLTGGSNSNPFQSVVPNSSFFAPASQVQDNSAQNAVVGREGKLQDATGQGNAGTGAAIGAGSALTGAGIGALLAADYAQAATFFGMAGMEFGQAAADSGSSAANNGQRNTLLGEGGQTSSQAPYDPSAVAQSLMTPNNMAALQSAGVDPNAFLNSLAQGNIQSGTSAYAALGQDVSALSPAQQTALDDPNAVDTKGVLNSIGLGVNDGASLNSNGGVASSLGSSAVGKVASSSSMAQPSPGNASATNGGLPTRNGTLTSQGVGPGSSGEGGKEGLGLQGLLGAFGVLPDGEASFGGLAGALSRSDLQALGVTKAKGQTIFKVASRNYHSFLKWRTMRYPKSKAPARGIASIP